MTFFAFFYVKDISQAMSKNYIYLYADDLNIFYQHKDVMEIEKVLNKEFANICEWFIDNKLLSHFTEDKTKYILYSRKIPVGASYNIR